MNAPGGGAQGARGRADGAEGRATRARVTEASSAQADVRIAEASPARADVRIAEASPVGARGGDAPPGGRAFWVGTAIGTAITGFGVWGLVHNLHGIALTSWLKTVATGLVVHDALFAPLVLAGSVVLARVVPGAIRAPVQVALIVSGALVAVAIPVVVGAGRLANNPSILPSHHYGARLLAALAVVWAIAALFAIAGPRRRRA